MLAYKNISKTTLPGLLGLALILPSLESSALEWYAEPTASVGTGYDDNVNMVAGPHDTVLGIIVSPNLILSAKSEQWSFSGHTKLTRYEFPGNSEESRTDYLLDLTYTQQNELNQWQLASNLTRDSSLLSELSQTGVPVRSQRLYQSLSPAWAHAITERDIFTLGHNYENVTYSRTSGNNVRDYVTQSPFISLKHNFSEKQIATLSLAYSDYKTESPITISSSKFNVSTTSANLGISQTFSDTLTGSITVGARKSTSTTSGLTCEFNLGQCFPEEFSLSDSSNGSLLDATLEKTFESSQFTAGLSRSLQPSSFGGVLQTDQVTAGYNAKLSPRLTGGLNFSAYKSQQLKSTSDSTTYKYYNIMPTLAWQITEWWGATTYYSRSISQNSSSQNITGNAINLTVNYNWPRISRSR